MPVHVSSAQQHRRRKHSQIIDISDESEAQRPNLAGGGGTAEAKRQCVENTAAAPTQIMPAAANANDDGSPASCGERRQTTIALRLRGGGPTVDSGVTTRRTRAAAAALRSGGTPTTNKARPAPPPTRPQSSARPAGGGNSSGSLSSSGGGASDNDSGVNVNERAPLLLGTPRSAQSNRHVDAAAAAPAPIIPPSAPRMPTADSKPAIAAKAGTVTPSAAAASGSAGGGFMDSSAASVAAGGGPSSRMQDQQAAVEAPAPGGGPARPDPNARPTNNDNNANEGGGGDGGGDNGSNSVEERPATLAVLNIRCPVPPPVPPPPPQRPPSQQQPPPPTQQRKMPRDGPIVKVLVPTPGGEHAVTERELGRCIVQATGIGIVPPTADEGGWGWREGGLGYDPYAQYNPSGGADGNAEPPLAGLFRARDGLFLPLSYVLANALALQGELLSITRPVYRPRPPPPPPPIWPYVAGGLFVASIMARYGIDWDWFFDVTLYSAELAIRFLINLPFQLFNVLVEIPLRETYRHGPSFIGWEGQPLPRICSQVTFHGDEAFWSRNMQECEKIYAAKEAAAMHIRKPLLYIAVAAGLFFAAQSLVRTNAIRRQYRPDRNMYDVYNALNTLLRQVNRAGGGTGMPRR